MTDERVQALLNLSEADRAELARAGFDEAALDVLLPIVSWAVARIMAVGGDVVGGDHVTGDKFGGDRVNGPKIEINSPLPPEVIQKLLALTAASAFNPDLHNKFFAAACSIAPELAYDDFVSLARRMRAAQKRDEPLPRAERDEPLYVPLAMKFSREHRPSAEQPFEHDATFGDIVEAVQAPQAGADTGPHPALVLLGEPGGGKSTALRHLTFNRFNALLAGEETRLPLFVSLGDYREAALDDLRDLTQRPRLKLSPLNFLRAHWLRWLGGDGFERALDEGRVWLILDGLNELPERDARVADWVQFFDRATGQFAPGNRAVIACRKADYGNWLNLPRLTIEPLDPPRIADFVGRRLQPLGQAAIVDVLGRLVADEKLLEVVGNPFWLRLLTDYVEEHTGQLPADRATLIDWFVDEWLNYGQGQRADLPALGSDKIEQLKNALEPFGYWMLGEGDNTPVEWQAACGCCGEWPGHSAEDALRRAEAASLLVSEGEGRGRRVRFYHQLILEYFAGRELAWQFRHGQPQTEHWRIPWEKWKFVHSDWQSLGGPPTTRWEEATVFAAARPDIDFDALVRAVLAEHPPLAARCVLERAAARKPVFEALRQAVVTRLLDVVERRDAALAAIEDPAAQLSLRIAAGHALGRLGDPRIDNEQTRGRAVIEVFRHGDVGTTVSGTTISGTTVSDRSDGIPMPSHIEVDFIEPVWCPVSAGPFTMGADDGFPQDRPAHTCDVIERAYAIGMFPVTNAEYECFVQAQGYEVEDYWTPQGWEWRHQDIATAQPPSWVFWRRNWAKDKLDWIRQWPEQGYRSPAEVEYWLAEAQRTDEELIANWRRRELSLGRARNPWRDDRDLNGANQPVVGVCWHEALAYCKWLTTVLRAAGRIRADQEVTLPNEPQWEKAARAAIRALTPREARPSPVPPEAAEQARGDYPWPGDFDKWRANTLEGRVLTTTPVGVYDNAAPCGALDMSGNVWEWTRSRWGDDSAQVTFDYPYSKDLAERERPDADDYRIVRGGSWYNEARSVRVACRSGNPPDIRYSNLGFRCVLQSLIA